ncbi:MAG TPA: SAM-dependent methyltransferase [Chitinophagaceae bacterium]|nr:SAM-dependent methyltransferase [Chitinophagaceae bacterium]
MSSTVYLIPSLLADDAPETIAPYVIEAVKKCNIFFVENQRSARRFLKLYWKEMIIDNYEWYTIHKAENEVVNEFKQKIKEGKNIAIISEAGCPGIADPGQILIKAAQEMNAEIKPLVGPSSVILALMASGMNGQQFQFVGYLPVDNAERAKALKLLEHESKNKNCTQIFIETPYRNNQLLETIYKTCQPLTRLCIAANITSAREYIKTKTIGEWKKEKPDFHKNPVIFCLQA